MQSFAAQAVIAIENARLLDEPRHRTEELGQSVSESQAPEKCLEPLTRRSSETVLSTIVAKAVQLSDTEAGAIYVLDELEREFRRRATYGMNQELIDALRHQHIGMDEPNIERAFTEGEAIQVRIRERTLPRPPTRSSCAPDTARGWWCRCCVVRCRRHAAVRRVNPAPSHRTSST